MFCSKCGAQVPDDSTFCSACGNALNADTAPATQPQAPAQPQQPPVQPQPQPARPGYGAAAIPVSKLKFFFNVAPSNKKLMSIIALILGLACALSVFLAFGRTTRGSIFEIPLLTLGGGDDLGDLQDELDQAVAEVKMLNDSDELADFVEEILEINVYNLESQIGMPMNKFLDLFTPLSLNNMLKLADIFGAKNSEPIKAFSAVMSVVNGAMWVLIALTLLGVLFQKTWLMVLTYILGFALIWLTGGLIYFLLATALYITTAVLFSKMKFEYKVYLASFKVA